VSAVRAALPGRYQALADIGAGIGVRQGEIFGLAVDDVPWLRRGKVKIRRQVRQVRLVAGKPCFALPKGNREREIPLPGSVSLALSAHLDQFPAAEVTLPWEVPGGKPVTARLILATPDGRALHRNMFNSGTWRPALKAAGVPAERENCGTTSLRWHWPTGWTSGP
jgi:integrase